MSVGASIEMGVPDGFVTTDFLDGRTTQVRKRAFWLGTGQVTTPATLRVRLIDACPAEVRVGRATQLEFAPFAIIPIPLGFRELRWVQMTGRAALYDRISDEGADSRRQRVGGIERPDSADRAGWIGSCSRVEPASRKSTSAL
jgi:hypothetical protein